MTSNHCREYEFNRSNTTIFLSNLNSHTLTFISIRAILNETTVHQYHLSQKFLIIITDHTQSGTDRLDKAFGILWKNGLINSHVLTMDENQYWSIYTFFPYQTDCQSLTQLKVATFTPFNYSSSMALHINQLYPYKLIFNMCPIYVAVQNNHPFSYGQNTSSGDIQFEGIEVDLVNVASVPLNLSVIYKLSFTEDAGMTYENNTPTEPTVWVNN